MDRQDQQGGQGGQGQGHGPGPKQQAMKAISGTRSRANENAGKMKSTPADIFIYGVHKETMKSDIVDDLKDSGIVIREEDIEKKTREGQNVDSYRISVKAEDLEKALDPSLWPLRVRVREWIHYPTRRRGQDRREQDEGNRFGQGRNGGKGRGVQPGEDGWNTVGGTGGNKNIAKEPTIVSQNPFNGLQLDAQNEIVSSQQ